MELVEFFHPALMSLDYKMASVKMKIILSSFFFFGITYWLSATLSMFMVTYKNLRTKEKVFWNLAVVRGIYGVFCIVMGVWFIFFDDKLHKDVVFATSPTSYFALTVTVGFFMFECSALLVSDFVFKQANVLLNIHHWLSLVGYSLLMIMESPHFFGCHGLILEMSTPFSCICWTLLKAKMSDTFLWRANQLILVHAFHVRSVAEFYLWYKTYLNWQRVWSAMPMTMFLCLYIQLLLVTVVMTPYWTYKKTAQMFNPVDWNFEDSEQNKLLNGDAKIKGKKAN